MSLPPPVAAALALAIALLSCAGCGIAPPSPLADDAEVVKAGAAAKAGRPLPRLAVAAVEVAYPLTFDLSAEPGRMPASLDRDAFTAAIAADIEAYTGFGKPAVLAAGRASPADAAPGAGGAGGGAERPGSPAYAAARRSALCVEAAARGAELLLVPSLTRCEVAFDRRNPAWIWNVMLWLYLWFPAWFVQDEDFAAEATLEVTLVSVASERVVHRAEVSARHVESLDDFDRGWDFLGIFRFPGSISVDQLRKVEEVLLPHALRGLEKRLVLELAQAWPRALADPERREEIARADASVVALLVGVGKYRDDARIAAPPGAAGDVEALEALLREDLGVPAKNILRLEGRAATKYRIEQDGLADHLARRARPQDTVLLYFSGVGATALPAGAGAAAPTGTPVLLPHDADLADLARTAVPLEGIARALRGSPARRAIVIADAAFGPAAGGTRSLRGAAAGPPPLASFAEATRAGEGREAVLLTATGGGEEAGRGEDAIDLPEARRGLFSYLLCEGARGRADADASGEVSVAELAAYVARHARAQAGLEGVLSAPAHFRGGALVPAATGGGSWLPRPRDVKER
jgi:hypothetical protein